MVLDRPGLRNQGVTEKTRVIAVNMPNIVGIADKGYKDYLTTVDELETLTGYNFLDVPEEIQKVIEAKKDAVFATQPFGQGEWKIANLPSKKSQSAEVMASSFYP
ncbi:MAG: hypothetical protein KME13_24055 [Myxacorys californica WJT36-NPBG1]|nr:hypothetical protein [Myxacorys californica WJT36-NPBG1]